MADIIDRSPDFSALVLADRADHFVDASNMVSLTRCEICGEPIPEARRVAVPGCRLCTRCQEESEQC